MTQTIILRRKVEMGRSIWQTLPTTPNIEQAPIHARVVVTQAAPIAPRRGTKRMCPTKANSRSGSTRAKGHLKWPDAINIDTPTEIIAIPRVPKMSIASAGAEGKKGLP